jgi:hypothetical protein
MMKVWHEGGWLGDVARSVMVYNDIVDVAIY